MIFDFTDFWGGSEQEGMVQIDVLNGTETFEFDFVISLSDTLNFTGQKIATLTRQRLSNLCIFEPPLTPFSLRFFSPLSSKF